MLVITEKEREGEGERKCNRENEKKRVNVGQWGGGRQKGKKDGEKGRKWGRERWNRVEEK